MPTSIETVCDTLRDTLRASPLNLREIGWHGSKPGASELRRPGAAPMYDLDLSGEGTLTDWSGGLAEAEQPIEVALYVSTEGRRDLREVITDLTDHAEDVQRVVYHRSGLEIVSTPRLDVDAMPEGDALSARVVFRVRYQLAISGGAV